MLNLDLQERKNSAEITS